MSVKAVFCLFYWFDQLVYSQGMPAGFGGRDTGMSWEKEIEGRGFCDLLVMVSEQKERPWQGMRE